MPKGVEHVKFLADKNKTAYVHSSVMPKGVEHSKDQNQHAELDGGPFIRDAERR